MYPPLLSVLLTLTSALACGCAATVSPPPRPADPVPVYLTTYGTHSTVLMPVAPGRYVEYAYGDWAYAALNRTWPHNAVGALLFSQQAALGRRFTDVAEGGGVPKHWIGDARLTRIDLDRDRVAAVVAELDRTFRASPEPPVTNPSNQLTFAKVPGRYSLFDNCNGLTTRVLRKLGCDVSRSPMFPTYKVTRATVKDAPPQQASAR